jgi:hypothetical protein
MTTAIWSILAIAISLSALLPLALRDPKRLRSAVRLGAAPQDALGVTRRRRLGWVSVTPGLLLALAGQWPAFLIWLGAAAACGWALAQGLAPRPSRKLANESNSQ